MRWTRARHYSVFVIAGIAILAATASRSAPKGSTEKQDWQSSFHERSEDLANAGENRYFPLRPGYTLELESREGKELKHLSFVITDRTRLVDGVLTRVIEERETINGKLEELSRNFFAISKRTHNVYYFGEEVDEYRNGKISGHGGSWLAGVKGAHYGMYMPGQPEKGQRFYQENAPTVAMDRCEVADTEARFATPAKEFQHVVVVTESTPLEPKVHETKRYAPGIGLVQDEEMKLVSTSR